MAKKKKLNKKRIVITIIILILILTTSTIITINQINLNKYHQQIKEQSKILKDNVKSYNEIRTTLFNEMNSFTYFNFPDKEPTYQEIFNNYNNLIIKIKSNIKDINKICKKKNNKICNQISNNYELMINLYIEDVTNYNNKIISYNTQYNTNLKEQPLIYK